MSPKYGVHVFSNVGWQRDYFTANSLQEVKDKFAQWADDFAYRDEQTSATLDLFNPLDNADESHSDYPLAQVRFGPRGGVVIDTRI